LSGEGILSELMRAGLCDAMFTVSSTPRRTHCQTS